MSGTLQEWYWLVGMLVGLIATVINITLFVRNKPDRIKAAVQQAIEPLLKRMDHMEITTKAQGQQLEQQARSFARVEETLKHLPNREEMNHLHGRLTDLVKDTSELRGAARTETLLLDRINQFLIQGNR